MILICRRKRSPSPNRGSDVAITSKSGRNSAAPSAPAPYNNAHEWLGLTVITLIIVKFRREVPTLMAGCTFDFFRHQEI